MLKLFLELGQFHLVTLLLIPQLFELLFVGQLLLLEFLQFLSETGVTVLETNFQTLATFQTFCLIGQGLVANASSVFQGRRAQQEKKKLQWSVANCGGPQLKIVNFPIAK